MWGQVGEGEEMRPTCATAHGRPSAEENVGWGHRMLSLVALGTSCRTTPIMTIFLLTDVYFIATLSFLWKVSVITLVSCLPLYVLKYLRRRFSPPSYSKLTS